MILALVLAAVTAAAESPDDRLFRLGGENHVLQMRLHDQFFENATNRARLKGDGFASACTAHFLAFRKVEPKYAEGLRPIVVQSMRDVVPAERLSAAKVSIGHDPAIVAWKNRVQDSIKAKGASLLANAAADYDLQLPSQLERAGKLSLPAPVSLDRSAMNAPQLAIACFTYFGNNREAILAEAKDGDTL